MKHVEWTTLRDSLDLDPGAVAREESVIEAALAGYTLRELRQRSGLTQAQLAERMHVSQRRVSAIERGEVTRSEFDTIRSYVAALEGQVYLVAEVGNTVVRIA